MEWLFGEGVGLALPLKPTLYTLKTYLVYIYIGWDVEWLFGEGAGLALKQRYPYYPSLGTGVGLDVRMLFDCVQVRYQV